MASPGWMIVLSPPLPHLININVNFSRVSLPRISHKTKYCAAVVINFVDSLFAVHLVSIQGIQANTIYCFRAEIL